MAGRRPSTLTTLLRRRDLGTGLTLEAGVSALLYVNSVTNVNGTVPQAGVNIPVDNIEGKVNVPARRRKLQVAVEEPAAGSRTLQSAAAEPTADEAVHGVPRKLHQTLSASDIGGLTANGFWEALSSVLPPDLMKNLTQLLEASARPVDEFLDRSGTTPTELQAAIAEYGPSGDLTVTEPQKLPLIPQVRALKIGVRARRTR